MSNLKHGARAERFGIALADFEKRHPAVYRDIRKLRAVLERQKAGPEGVVPLETVAHINQICRWEITARITQRMVAVGGLGPTETINALNTMTHATRQRDSLLGKLGLNGAPDGDDDAWAQFDAQQAEGAARQAEAGHGGGDPDG